MWIRKHDLQELSKGKHPHPQRLSKLVMHPWKLIGVSLKNEIPSGKDGVQIQSQRKKVNLGFCVSFT